MGGGEEHDERKEWFHVDPLMTTHEPPKLMEDNVYSTLSTTRTNELNGLCVVTSVKGIIKCTVQHAWMSSPVL